MYQVSATDTLRGNLSSAGIAMRMALAEFDPEEMAHEPEIGLRSIETLLGEATIALRDTLTIIEHEDLPEVPRGFEARYARWGTGAELDEVDVDLPLIFLGHLEALKGAIRTLEADDLDEILDPPGSFGEDGLFSFETVGRMIAAVSGLVHFFASEASMIRVALGKPVARGDSFDDFSEGRAGPASDSIK